MSGAQGAGGASPVWGAELGWRRFGERFVVRAMLRLFGGRSRGGGGLGRRFAGFWGGVLGLGRLFLTGGGGGEKFFLQKRFKNY